MAWFERLHQTGTLMTNNPQHDDVYTVEPDADLQRLLAVARKTVNRLNSRNYALERQRNRKQVQELANKQVFTINYKKGSTQIEKLRTEPEKRQGRVKKVDSDD